jgi:Fe-S-cluster containining protein
VPHSHDQPEDSNRLAAQWRAAAADPAVCAELWAVYAIVADQIAARAPACWASGRCCNFRQAGHRLYVTGLEAACTLHRLAVPTSAQSLAPALAAAAARGDCPFLSGHLCGVHEIKPLGCRVYFCDKSAQDWQQDLSERAINMIRAIHDRHNIEYRYGEWGAMLSMMAGTDTA